MRRFPGCPLHPILVFALAAPLSAQSSTPKVPMGIPAPAEGVRVVAYGTGVPVLGCDSLAVCRIELEAGERFRMAPALGDSERWLTIYDGGGPVPVVLVKPKTCGIATNLMLLTDRRSYDLDLEAGPCKGPKRERVYAVRFEHPAVPVVAEVAAKGEARVPTLAERAGWAGNTSYRWRKRGRFPWVPERVADDGEHVYLQLPPAARSSAAPVLYELDSGERALLNYATEGDLYVTDRLFGRAALVIGEATLEIEQRAPRRPPVLNRKEVAAVSLLVGAVAASWMGR